MPNVIILMLCLNGSCIHHPLITQYASQQDCIAQAVDEARRLEEEYKGLKLKSFICGKTYPAPRES